MNSETCSILRLELPSGRVPVAHYCSWLCNGFFIVSFPNVLPHFLASVLCDHPSCFRICFPGNPTESTASKSVYSILHVSTPFLLTNLSYISKLLRSFKSSTDQLQKQPILHVLPATNTRPSCNYAKTLINAEKLNK